MAITRPMQSIHLQRNAEAVEGFIAIIDWNVIDDVESTNSSVSKRVADVPAAHAEYLDVIAKAQALRQSILAYSAALGKPLS